MARRSLFAPERTEAECLWLWPTILIRVPAGSQDADFADRIEHQPMRPGWEASPLQLTMMRDFCKRYAPEGIRLDPDLMEGAEIRWTPERIEAEIVPKQTHWDLPNGYSAECKEVAKTGEVQITFWKGGVRDETTIVTCPNWSGVEAAIKEIEGMMAP